MVPGEPGGSLSIDVFVYDLLLGTTQKVSANTAGGHSNNHSTRPSISADGRYVAFQSDASDLIATDLNNKTDTFIRDMLTGTLIRVVGPGSVDPAISADGRYVAFRSNANNLVPGDTNGFTNDVFVQDLATRVNVRVSVDTAGGDPNGASDRPSISADGGLVVFDSLASDLVPGDSNGFADVFARTLPGVTCGGQRATRVGTAGNDVLNGSAGVDVIVAGNGNDTVNGLGGNDILCGGAGNDILNGGIDNDQLFGGDATDTLSGGTGDDRLDGEAGIDTASYVSSATSVQVDLELGTATGDGADTLAGVENVAGSGFSDVLRGSEAPNTISAGAGVDTVSGFGGDDQLQGAAGNDKLYGHVGNDVIGGGAGNDLLSGAAGFDNLDGGPGTDTCGQGAGSGAVVNCEG